MAVLKLQSEPAWLLCSSTVYLKVAKAQMVALEVVVAVVLVAVLALLVVLLLRHHQRRARMFLFKSKPKSKVGHVSFLQKADACLDKAFQTQDIRELPRFFEKGECLRSMVKRIQNKENFDVGVVRYRHINWQLLEEAGDTFTYIKDVSFDDIKVSKNLMAAVGDAYKERWKIFQRPDGSTTVIEVRRLQTC